MASYSKTIIIGNLTRDIELKYTQGGVAIANFSLAVNKRYKNKSGEMVDKCSFIDCKAFGRTAEVLSEYVPKGKPVFVEGELEQESWEKDGVKHSKIVVNVSTIQLIGGRDSGGSSYSQSSEYRQHSPGESSQATDDIPF